MNAEISECFPAEKEISKYEKNTWSSFLKAVVCDKS